MPAACSEGLSSSSAPAGSSACREHANVVVLWPVIVPGLGSETRDWQRG